jgi:glutaryl-CoA dehydrogenase
MTGTAALVQPSAARAESHFDWSDPLLLDEALTEDERMVRDSAHAYCQEKLFPRVPEANRHDVSTANHERDGGARFSG